MTTEVSRSRRSFLRLALAAVATGLGAACIPAPTPSSQPTATAPPQPAQPTAIATSAIRSPGMPMVKWGVVPGASQAPLYIAQAKGYFAEQGIDFDLTAFNTSVAMVAPLGQNQLQAGTGTVSAGLLNAIGRGIAIRIVADAARFSPGHGNQAVVVRAPLADQITGPADLKGRTYTDAGPDTTGEVMLAMYLRRGGLTIKDVNYAQLPFPDMQSALESGKVDVATPVEPFLTRILESGAARLLVRFDTVMPGAQSGMVLFSEQLAQERDVAARVLAAYLKGVRFYDAAFIKQDPARRTEAIQIVSNAINFDPLLLDRIVQVDIDPDGKVNLEAIETDQQYFLAKGSQEKPVDLNTAVDLTLAEEAVRILGPYR